MSRILFPATIVDSHNERTNVQRTRRTPGVLLQMSEYRLGENISDAALETGGQASQEIQTAADVLRTGLEFLKDFSPSPCVHLTYDAAKKRQNVKTAWMKDHNVLADWLEDDQEPCLRLDAEWPSKIGLQAERNIGDPTARGAAVLGAFLHLYFFSAMGGANQREMLHTLLDFASLLPEADLAELHKILRGRMIDANNAFSLFLTMANDENLAHELEQLDLKPLRGLRTAVLFEAGNRLEFDLFKFRRAGGKGKFELAACLQKIAGRQEGAVVLEEEAKILLERIEAYVHEGEKAAPEAAASLLEKTLKWRDWSASWLLGQLRLDMPYDQSRVARLLSEPIEDIDEKRALINEAVSSTYDFELEGKNILRLTRWARDNHMRLVAGRLSRAFGNQAHLLSVSKILADKAGLLPHARRLYEAGMEAPDLQTQASRLLHLIQQRKPTPYAQTVGALNQFEEALFSYQSKEFKKMLQEKDDASRRIVGRPGAEACGEVLDAIQERIRSIYRLAAAFRGQLEQTRKDPASYIVYLQRLHPAETVNLANANLLRDVHPGKEDDLRDLTRQGGHFTYSSQGLGRIRQDGSDTAEDTHWIIQVDDWIEAIPLFIHERVVHRTVKIGSEETKIEVIETEVDQDAMEVFFRLHAEFWARNIDAVMDSEHAGCARRMLARRDEKLTQIAQDYRLAHPDKSEDDAATCAILQSLDLHEGAAALAALIAAAYREGIEAVNALVEREDIPRIEALERTILEKTDSKAAAKIQALLKKKSAAEIARASLAEIKASKNGLAAEAARLQSLIDRPTRRVSSLHILTTESAGMTEGYVQSWIEEEMALFNVIRREGLESEVKESMDQYRTRILSIGKKVIGEFGMGVVIEEVMAQQRLPEPAAVLTVLMSFRPVMEEAAKLAVLIEQDERQGNRKVKFDNAADPQSVDEYIEKHRSKLTNIAVQKVAANNGKAFDKRVSQMKAEKPKLSLYDLQKRVIEAEADYREEMEAIIRFEARSRILDELDARFPEQHLRDQARTYIRTHTNLSKSTARKEVVAKHKFHALAMHPLNYYQAAGGNKRYNLLYTPSRVNLGERERDSVVKWRQWVGGADRWAALAGFEFYNLINEGGVEERPALAYAEIQKTSENALCVTHFAGSNALALLCMAVLEGDAEDMADQMNLRQDRLIPPAGEGYGGYCVPKDGLFLAFVLSLRNEVKLRQMGIPERFHSGIMKMAKETLLRQNDFESHFEWQRWAANKLLKYSELKKYFDFKDDLLVFHIAKIARAIENLGQPWHETTEGSKLVANLAAQWGVDKMIIRAEQVNRFMVFYKAWLIYDAIREAKAENPNCPAEDEAVIALTAEYKPVQDIRYSTGMRLFEILAQTGEHLTHSLDEEGQNLAYLMFHGFDPDTDHPVGQRALRQLYSSFQLGEASQETLNRLKEAFPPHKAPGDIVMTSVTMSSTQDMLYYSSDAKLDEIANQAQVILGDYGLTEEQIRANASVYGGRLRRWGGVKPLPPKEQDELAAALGGKIHALVLKMRGPGRDYERDIQGIDVLNTGIPFPELLALLDDMPKVVSLMRNGNPYSSLAIADGAAGRARRALTYLDVQLFFAACEKIGRQGVYRAIGLGKRNIDRLRAEMRRKRERALRLYEAVAAVIKAKDDKSREKTAASALELYRKLRDEVAAADEAGKALREEEKMKRYKKWKNRDYYISQALAKIGAGLSLSQADFGVWTAGVGGLFALCGESEAAISSMRETWTQAVQILAAFDAAAEHVHSFSSEEQNDLMKCAVRPEYVPETQRFAQQMLVESSSKAVEIAAREALERRKALKVRAERARAFNDREDGFREAFKDGAALSFEVSWQEGQKCLAAIRKDLDALIALNEDGPQRKKLQSQINRSFGQVIGHTRSSIADLVATIMPEADEEQRSMKRRILDDLAILYTGREIIFEDLKRLAGGYEDIGGFARLAEAANGDRAILDKIAKAIELFYITFALAQTLESALALPEEVDTGLFWKNITDFFAETINDHWYEYWPWAYSRGVGFLAIPREDRFALAVERHAWLYDYIRLLFVHRTELSQWNADDRDALLGDFTSGKCLTGIGAGAPNEMELRWRAYNQLRELAFLKGDGFLMPLVFHEFDPAIIEADKRVNVVFLFPAGRTHVSRALREGPSLNAELQEKKHPGTNFLITRNGEFADVEAAKRKALLIEDAHLYISEKEFAEALTIHKGLKKDEIKQQIQAAKEEGRLSPKGIRVAVRFGKDGQPAPVVVGALIPFHGHPVYIGGQSEAEGMPATIQSRVYTDVTYDKSLYPQIFIEGTGVELPPEIDWMKEWNLVLSNKEILERIAEGLPSANYAGLRAFAKQHPIILIKGAAESGARNLKVFEVQDDRTRIKEDELRAAAQFVADVSRSQNAVIQAAVFASPELWASPELMESFVDRQILEWNTPVNRDSYPRSQIYGSMRIVASSSHPGKKYDTAFAISLISLQVATNVGRGGTLEALREEDIQPQFRKQIMKGLHAEGPKVMKAMTEFVKRYGPEWEKKNNAKIGDDLRGVSYGWANYLMSDYVIFPVYKRNGRLVDILPRIDENGRRIGSIPILQDEEGRFEGEIADWKFIHLEPNVGIGLWDRFNLREEVRELRASQKEKRPFDWNNIGVSDRIVMRNYVLSGEDYLKANFGKQGIDRQAVNNAVKK
ncbi:MAG: hypothetical protein AB1656_02590 [Candidatus Omnitrophota bacterium]